RSPSIANDANGCCCATYDAWEQPRSGLRLSGGVRGTQARERSPTRVGVVVSVVGIEIGEPFAAGRAQADTVVGAHRVERKIEHDGVPQHRLEVEQVAVDCRLVFAGVGRAVDEKLL